MPALTYHSRPAPYAEQVTIVVHQGTAIVADADGTHSVSEGSQHSTPSAGGCVVSAADSEGCNFYILNEPTDSVDRPENKAATQPDEDVGNEPTKADLNERAKALGIKGRSKLAKDALAKKVRAAEKKADHPSEDHPEPKATKKRPKPAAEKVAKQTKGRKAAK